MGLEEKEGLEEQVGEMEVGMVMGVVEDLDEVEVF